MGDAIADFQVGLSVGFGTVIGAFITAYAAIKLDWIPTAGAPGAASASGAPASPDLKPLARKLMAVLRVTATYDPAGGTLPGRGHLAAGNGQRSREDGRSEPTAALHHSAPVLLYAPRRGGPGRRFPEAGAATNTAQANLAPVSMLEGGAKTMTQPGPGRASWRTSSRSITQKRR